MEQAVAETRSMARTLGGPHQPDRTWDSDFADPWTSMLVEAGRAVAGAHPDDVRAVRVRLEALVHELSASERLSGRWPVHGALVINLRNVLDAMDEVAANPLVLPPLPSVHRRTVRP
jgi:hypothetical protein